MAENNERNLPVLQQSGEEKTTVGNYFVSNYPPYSFWKPDQVQEVERVLDTPADDGTPLGLYMHIPFCRKRCDFCYFKVYTDKNAKQIRRYLDAAIDEMARLASRPRLQNRKLDFVYFGGGTPSYLSVEQLAYLFEGLRANLPWDGAEEIAFECEPGTLQEKKIRALRDMGITRLSLGVENFNPEVLELNNRAHRAKEIYKAYEIARDCGYPQINIDLIAGMLDESDDNWKMCIDDTLKLAPESVTIYQMEIPYNTTIYRRMREDGTRVAPVADWQTKRRWVTEAFARLQSEGGYKVGSAYTAVKDDSVDFLYRDLLWGGADMVGIGVSSISHVGGVHYQNEHKFDPYVERVEAGELPIQRALAISDDERFIREFVLQLKIGSSNIGYFEEKFGVNPAVRYRDKLARHQSEGMLTFSDSNINLTQEGLLQVDRILYDFFLDEHRDARYA
ncbi:MAG: coproporphyrinogen-III oxidase family protein [Planctomycetota bacterium]